MDDAPSFSNRWQQWRQKVDLDEYETRWERLEARGHDVHGEANFIARYAENRVLDAGCGMGRVGLELARQGYDVVGVDNDDEMLARARRQESTADWRLGDLTDVRLDGKFDTIAMAGNVLIFVEPDRRHLVVANLVRWLDDDGYLISGSSTGPPFDLSDYDDWCIQAGLTLVERFGAWDRSPFVGGGDYAVSVHRLLGQPERGSAADPAEAAN